MNCRCPLLPRRSKATGYSGKDVPGVPLADERVLAAETQGSPILVTSGIKLTPTGLGVDFLMLQEHSDELANPS